MRAIISRLSENWNKHKDAVFIINSKNNVSYTYNDIFILAAKSAAYLKSCGINKGDHVAIYMQKSIDVAVIYFGCIFMGAVAVPINPVLGVENANYVIKHSEAKIVLTDDAKSGHQFIDDYLKLIENFENNLPVFDGIVDNDKLIVVYTSGTSAQPKGVVHTYGSLFGNGFMFTEHMGIGSNNRFINYLPMSYLGGYYNLLMLPFTAGSSVVLCDAFSAETIFHYWSPIIKYKVNTLWLVPTIVAMLLKYDRDDIGITYCSENKILGLVGTAPLSDSQKQAFTNKYHFNLYENYALSETLFLTSNSITSMDGVGKILAGVKFKLIDKGVEASSGEIAVKTKYHMNGYLGMPEYDGDWFYTGDIGERRGESIYITGRKKDLIIKGGINISPLYIEEILQKSPYVNDVCVIGIENSIMGEEIVFILKMDDIEYKQHIGKIQEFINENLSQIHKPTHILNLPEFPVTPTGKVQKAKLRVWATEEVKNKKDNKTAKQLGVTYKVSEKVSAMSQATSVKYNNTVYELQQNGIDVTILSLGEAFFDIPMFSFESLPIPDVYHYSHSRGIKSLRDKLSDFFLEKYEVKFEPDSEILITAGSKIAIYMAILAIINSGDEVIVPEPAWVSYMAQISLCGGISVTIPCTMSVFDFESYITNRTKLIIVNNPNNPSGKIYSVDELTHLVHLAKKYGLFILSDEAYSEFVLDRNDFVSIGNIDKEKKFSIICNSMSKNYGMSGWRVGYVIANKMIIDQILKLNQHLITCPATILEHYLSRYFNDILNITEPQINAVVCKRAKIISYLKAIGLECMEGEATFYIFLSIKGSCKSSTEFADYLLHNHHIAVVPGIAYGASCDDFVRISIGAESEERIKNALNKIKEICSGNK